MTGSERWDSARRTRIRPTRLSLADWKAVLLRVKDQAAEDNLALVAAGVAFFAMLAFFPGVAAFVGAYGLIADADAVTDHLGMLETMLPPEAYGIVEGQITSLTSASGGGLGLASLLAIVLALWSARTGVNALMRALNMVYGARDSRGFLRRIVLTLALTLVLLAVAAIAFLAILAVPVVLSVFDFGASGEWLASAARWPIAIAAVVAALALLYRYAPDHPAAATAWVSWGATLATLFWILGSAAFSVYVANFANYNETYGSLGALVGLLMWFFLSAYIVLIGAEINAEIERRRKETSAKAA